MTLRVTLSFGSPPGGRWDYSWTFLHAGQALYQLRISPVPTNVVRPQKLPLFPDLLIDPSNVSLQTWSILYPHSQSFLPSTLLSPLTHQTQLVIFTWYRSRARLLQNGKVDTVWCDLYKLHTFYLLTVRCDQCKLHTFYPLTVQCDQCKLYTFYPLTIRCGQCKLYTFYLLTVRCGQCKLYTF